MPLGTDNIETQILAPEDLVNTEEARRAIAIEEAAAAGGATGAEAIPLPEQSKPATFAEMKGMDGKAEMSKLIYRNIRVLFP